ncbi:hypothetical protein Gorai_023121, partial [Gossypium raimondii]|nr:hypothetical protein [Gossypium raimondii]
KEGEIGIDLYLVGNFLLYGQKTFLFRFYYDIGLDRVVEVVKMGSFSSKGNSVGQDDIKGLFQNLAFLHNVGAYWGLIWAKIRKGIGGMVAGKPSGYLSPSACAEGSQPHLNCLKDLSREDPDDYAFKELFITKMQLNMENDMGERYWEQWALANWLDIGDRNMTLFHRFASHQNWLKIIDQLKKQNGWTFVGDEGIEWVTGGMNDFLCSRFRPEEIVATLHNMSPTKNKRRFEKVLYEVVNVRFEVWEAENSINCFQDKEALAFAHDKLSGIKEASSLEQQCDDSLSTLWSTTAMVIDHMELVEEEAVQGLSWADRPSA